jgi:apolipoprotein N-acyltransferase
MPRKISSLASAIAIGGWLGGYLTPIFAGNGIYMAWLPLLIAAISYLADSGVRAFHERTNYRWFVGYGALNWVGFEMIRGFIPHHTGMAFFIVYDPVTKARDKSKR